jgi:cobalt/nickel transport system permease protein
MMHIPDNMLHGAVCPVTAGVALLGVTAAVVAAAGSKDKPKVARFAAVAAMLFAVQLLNFPIGSGTSGHLLGATLAAVLLGTPFAVLAMTLVLSVQALAFGDGGLLSLGANVLNMALLAVGIGGVLRMLLHRRPDLSLPRRALVMAGGGWLSVMLAALAVSAELAASGVTSFATVVGAMLGTHAWIGIGEGLLSAALYLVLTHSFAKETRMAVPGHPLVLACAALMLSPWASRLPDGLERVTTQLGILGRAADLFAPLAGYRLPAVSHPQLSIMLAGFCGALLVFGVSWMLGSRLECRTRVPLNDR